MQKHKHPTFCNGAGGIVNQTVPSEVVLRWMHLVLAVLVYQNNNFQKYADINILLSDIREGRVSGYYPVENLWEIASAEFEMLEQVRQLNDFELEELVEYGQRYAMKQLYSVYQEEEQELVELFAKMELMLAA
jgi:hypothetical protein